MSDNSKVAETAYVGPNAMVLDGAIVKDNACIKEFAVVIGPDAVIGGNAKIGGKAWVFGKTKVGGNARILESVILAAKYRRRGGYRVHSTNYEGEAEITGSAVIKGEHIMRLCYARDQVLTGQLVVDYTPKIANRTSGVFSRGRFYQGGRFIWAYTPESRLGASLYNGLDTGGIYANYEFDQPKSYMLEDSYVNNNGILHGAPEFSRDADRRFVVFNGTDQYAQAPPSVADFGELTIDMMVNRSSGGRIFDFGTGANECFYLVAADKNGKLVLVARHGGKTHTISSSAAIAAGKWVAVRVEMNGSKASIYIDSKPVAKGKFEFRPRDVFIGDRAEGNFIGRGRGAGEFFKGKMDYFRIYRQVRDDFDAIDFLPPALTQVVDKESCARASKLAVKLAAGKGAAEWAERRAAKIKAMAPEPVRGIPGEGAKLRGRASEILNKSQKLTELNKKRGVLHTRRNELDKKVIEKFEALAETIKAGKDIDEHRKKIDDTRREIRSSGELDALRKKLPVLLARLEAARSISKLKASLEQKRRGLEKKKREFLAAQRKSGEHKDEYQKILAELAGIDRAIGKEKKRMHSDNIVELAAIGKRLHEIEMDAKWWRYDGQGLYAQRAGLTPNPFVISVDTRALTLQQGLKFSTTVDWDYRVREEISGVLPPIMKKWLERVRGY